MLELNCLFFGDVEDHILMVPIESTKNVSALKKLIKREKKHAFKGTDADNLVLWKFSKP